MGECNHCMWERALTVEDDVTVAFHKVVSHDNQSRFCNDQEEDAHDDVEQTEETVHLRTNCFKDEDAEEEQGARGSETVLEGSGKETLLCLPAFCVRGKKTASSGEQKVPAVFYIKTCLRYPQVFHFFYFY
ncbi:hypothetical protein ATANTOWER_003088 [Ataeniobius toweri]|uniref:Uncharacterized protein n=1 Tax=Ataeniobius toweri TaxID=208326 RepID=A0ABU7AP21_9TELE|nr:hypothetical protein [Ataeniobius toweri]